MFQVGSGSASAISCWRTFGSAMTQSTLRRKPAKSEAGRCKEPDGKGKADAPRYPSENCITIGAWVLLTVGLCVIGTTFYLAIVRRADEADEHFINTDDADNVTRQNDIDVLVEFNKSIRQTNEFIYGASEAAAPGCEEILCRVECTEAENLYDTLYETLSLSNCSSIDVLLITNQNFDRGIVKNAWVHQSRPVYELVLAASNVTKVKSSAFNSPIFSSLFHMQWHRLPLNKVEGGALLGLNSLKYLTIQTPIDELDRAFFQPVQTILRHLELNANLNIETNQSIFGISCLVALEYADLSNNNFNGPLTKEMFLGAPNIKYLHMTHAKISAIEGDAFDGLRGTLHVLNLSHNLLTVVSPTLLESLLAANSRIVISLAGNRWDCDCELHGFAQTFRTYRGQFMDALYCRKPNHLYGSFIDEVNLAGEGCDTSATTVNETSAEMDWHPSTSTSTAQPVNKTPSGGGGNLPIANDTGKYASNENSDVLATSNFFKIRCLHNDVSTDSSQPRSLELTASLSREEPHVASADQSAFAQRFYDKTNADKQQSDQPGSAGNLNSFSSATYSSELEYFQFERPEHEFELNLLQNRSVRVEIKHCKRQINIIWFSRQLELPPGTETTYETAANIDFQCSLYGEPYLIVDGLLENTTYTFCVLPSEQYTISPFNCLPLHVPPVTRLDDIWISKEEQQFTIGMLCLIFTLSTFFGAVVAYFGIKTYPELLEGSKNVLVVKKSDQTCHVSTISEMDYLKNSSMKKRSAKQNSSKTPLPPPLFNISVNNLERLSSMKSSATLFEDPFIPITLGNDQYELPKQYKRSLDYEERCVPNNYATSPCSPPPLPKRNSSGADNTNLVPNRFSRIN